MAFCTKCGKEITDGEICSCQSANTNSAANVDVTAAANGIVGSAKEMVADPETGAKNFVAGMTWVKAGVLTAIYAVMTVLFNVFSKIAYNIDRKKELKKSYKKVEDYIDMDFDEYLEEYGESMYDLGEFIKGIFTDIIYLVAGIAITAVVFYFAIKLIKKIQITWQAAFAISVIDLMIMIPLTLVYEVIGLLPDITILAWIMSAISSVRGLGATLLTYFGLKSKCNDSTSTVYVAIPAYAVCSIAITFVNFLLNSLIFN